MFLLLFRRAGILKLVLGSFFGFLFKQCATKAIFITAVLDTLYNFAVKVGSSLIDSVHFNHLLSNRLFGYSKFFICFFFGILLFISIHSFELLIEFGRNLLTFSLTYNYAMRYKKAYLANF